MHVSMCENIRTWLGFKDKLTPKDIPLLILCIFSLTPYILHFVRKKLEIILVLMVYTSALLLHFLHFWKMVPDRLYVGMEISAIYMT